MDRVWKQYRIGILVLLLVLLAAVAFRMYLPPGSTLTLSKHEREIRSKLEAINPPPGARLLRITVHHDQHEVWEGTAVHTVSAGMEDAESYYIKEFARNGFTYKTVAEQKPSRDRFCSPDYGAELIPLTRAEGASLYLISMTWKDATC